MSADSSSPTRRSIVATSAAAGAVSLLPAHSAVAAEGDAIRPFRVNVPEEQLVDLRQRVNATKWPERETVNDETQGVQFATRRNSRAIGEQTTTGGRSRRD